MPFPCNTRALGLRPPPPLSTHPVLSGNLHGVARGHVTTKAGEVTAALPAGYSLFKRKLQHELLVKLITTFSSDDFRN